MCKFSELFDEVNYRAFFMHYGKQGRETDKVLTYIKRAQWSSSLFTGGCSAATVYCRMALVELALKRTDTRRLCNSRQATRSKDSRMYSGQPLLQQSGILRSPTYQQLDPTNDKVDKDHTVRFFSCI